MASKRRLGLVFQAILEKKSKCAVKSQAA